MTIVQFVQSTWLNGTDNIVILLIGCFGASILIKDVIKNHRRKVYKKR